MIILSMHIIHIEIYCKQSKSCVGWLRGWRVDTYRVIEHIVLCFVLFFLVLCTLCCQFLWIVHFWLPLWYSLTFI